MPQVWTQFDYLYRDADNYKAFGSVAFSGEVAAEKWNKAQANLFEESCFIAEQIGVPSLCHQLFRWNGGSPTDADHCWHEFLGIKAVSEDDIGEDVPRGGSFKPFVERLSKVNAWNIFLSPNVLSM